MLVPWLLVMKIVGVQLDVCTQLISKAKPAPTLLPLDINCTVKGPAVDVMVGMPSAEAIPDQSKFPPNPSPLNICMKSQQFCPVNVPPICIKLPGLLGLSTVYPFEPSL
jgi:hypothetical protein